MLYKKFLSHTLRTISILVLSAIFLESAFTGPSEAMEQPDDPQKTTKKRARPHSAPSTEQKRQKKTSSDLVSVKEEPAHSRGLLTKEDLDEKVHLVNPQNGTMNCLKSNVSGYRMLRYQLSTPKKVNTRGPQDWNYLLNRNERDIDLIDFQQASLLPSGKIQLTDNGEIWTEELVIEDSKPITFKEKSMNEFQDLLKMMEFNRWNNGCFQAGLLFLKPVDSPEGGHFLTFYSYQPQGEERVDLIADFQWKEVFPAADLGEYVSKWNFSPTPYVWYDAPGLQALGARFSFKQEIDDSSLPLSSSISEENEGVGSSSFDYLLNYVTPSLTTSITLDDAYPNQEKEKETSESNIEYNSPLRKKGKITEADREKMRQLKEQGYTLAQIAEEIGCNKATIRVNLKKVSPALIQKKAANITEADREKMKQLKEQGHTLEQIAEKIGCHRQTVRVHLKQLDPTLIQKRTKITETDKEKMKQLKEQGYTHDQIAEETGCNKYTIRVNLKKACPALIHKKTNITEADKEKMKQLKEQGHTLEQIAEEIGCNKGTISVHLKQLDPALIHKKTKITEADKEKMKQLKKLGYTTREIAEEMGCSNTAVCSNLNRK